MQAPEHGIAESWLLFSLFLVRSLVQLLTTSSVKMKFHRRYGKVQGEPVSSS